MKTQSEEGPKNGTPNFSLVKSLEFTESMNSVCILKDERLASCTIGNSIMIFNLKTYEREILIETDHLDSIISLVVLANGHLLSSSADKRIKIWDVKETEYELVETLEGHNDWVYKVIELKNGKICSCSRDKTIKIWNSEAPFDCIKTMTGHTYSVISILETKEYIASGSGDGTVRLWSNTTYEPHRVIPNTPCQSWNGMLELKDKKLIVGGMFKLSIIDIVTFEVKIIEDKSLGCINCFNLLPNGQVLLGCAGGLICCFDPSNNTVIDKKKVHNGTVCSLIRTKDGRLISCSQDKTIQIFN